MARPADQDGGGVSGLRRMEAPSEEALKLAAMHMHWTYHRRSACQCEDVGQDEWDVEYGKRIAEALWPLAYRAGREDAANEIKQATDEAMADLDADLRTAQAEAVRGAAAGIREAMELGGAVLTGAQIADLLGGIANEIARDRPMQSG